MHCQRASASGVRGNCGRNVCGGSIRPDPTPRRARPNAGSDCSEKSNHDPTIRLTPPQGSDIDRAATLTAKSALRGSTIPLCFAAAPHYFSYDGIQHQQAMPPLW
jgi:hypothetical protein